MRTVLILFGLIALFCVSGSFAQQCDASTAQIASMKPDFGGIGPFYQIAKGISDGLQSTPNSKTYNDLNNLIFGNAGATSEQVIKDMIFNQIGAIVFWSVGFVIALAALVLGIVTAIWQCCFSCVPKGSNPRNPIVGYIYAGLHLAVFAFVLTGLILFNIAESNLVSSIDNSMQYTGQITNDLSNVIVNGTGQLTCEVNATTTATMNNMTAMLNNYPDVVVDGTANDVGVTAVNNFDSQAYSNQNQQTITAYSSLITALTSGVSSSDPNCGTYQTNLQNDNPTPILTALDLIVTTIQDNQEVKDINTKIGTIKTDIQQQANEAQTAIDNSQKSIDDSVQSINDMLNSVQNEIATVMNSFQSAYRDISTSSAYTTLQIVLRILVIIPAVTGLVFGGVAGVAIFFGLQNQEGVVSKLATVVLTTFYVSVAFAIILLLLSSIAFVGGWFMSAMCVPIFEDPKYQLFHLMNETINGTDTVNIGDLMEECSNSETTLYTAVNGSSVISANSILGGLDLNKYRDQADQQIDAANVPTFTVDPTWTTNSDKLATTLQDAKTNDLTVCQNSAVTQLYNYYIGNLSLSNDLTNQFMANVGQLQANSPNTTTIAKSKNNEQFDQGDAAINQSVSNLMTNLQTNIFKCRPLVDIYNNGGFVACEQYGKPIQGLWAAVGLCGLFMFILSILLLLTYRWLKTSDDAKNGSKSKSDEKKKNKKSQSKSQNDEDHSGKSGDVTPDHNDIFARPYLNNGSSSRPRGLPRVQPIQSELYHPRGVQVLPDERHPPMSPQFYDTQEYGLRNPQFEDVDLYEPESASYHGSTARGLRRF